MTNYEQLESSQRQHHEVLRHETAMIEASIGAEFKLFSILRPKLIKDGVQWCCLYGDDLQTGIAGFGDSPYNAVLNWNTEWQKCIEK